MVTAVTLGNFFTDSNGKTVLGGAGGSGLDTQSLIKSLTDAQKVQLNQINDQVKLNSSKSVALNELRTLLSDFQSATDALRNPPGVNNAASDAFRLTTANVGNGGSAYLAVLAKPGAVVQSYSVRDISSVATTAKQSTAAFTLASATSDATVGAVRFNTGTVTLQGGATVTVSSGDSLATIAANFNAVSDTSGISATVIQVSNTSFRLSFSATKTGTDANFDLTSAPTVTAGASVLADLGLGAAASGTNAVFRVNDVQITRQSNNIDDVISDVTFKIFQTTPDSVTNYSVNVEPDFNTIQNSIVNFANAYNALKTFEAKQTQLNADGTYASTAVLVNDATFKAVFTEINRNVNTRITGILGSNPSSLADVGITFTNLPATGTDPEITNAITIDDTALASALTTNFKGVKELFQFTLTSTNPNLILFRNTKPIGVTDITFNIVPGLNTFTAQYLVNGVPTTSNLIATKFTDNTAGYSLTGAAGTPLEGATFIYGSDSAATFTARITQGIAAQSYISTVQALEEESGTITVALEGLQESTNKLNEDAKTQDALIATYQESLIKRFAALERAISSANTLLQSLSANSNAQLIASGN